MELPNWLSSSFEQIAKQIQAELLAHAVLIDEPPGTGGSIFVEYVVRKLLHLPTNADLRTGAYADLDWLDSEAVTKRSSSQRRVPIIDVETIRAVIDYLQLTPSTQRFKIVVIEHAHQLNSQASNAFLKILEEPPNESFIFLISSRPDELLPTIRSRCAHVKLAMPSAQETIDWLVANDCEADIAEKYVLDYGAAPFDILKAYKEEGIIVRDCLILAGKNSLEIPNVANRFTQDDPASVLSRWQRSVIRFAQNVPHRADIFAHYDELSDLKRQYAESPALNWRLQFERLLFKWFQLYQVPR